MPVQQSTGRQVALSLPEVEMSGALAKAATSYRERAAAFAAARAELPRRYAAIDQARARDVSEVKDSLARGTEPKAAGHEPKARREYDQALLRRDGCAALLREADAKLLGAAGDAAPSEIARLQRQDGELTERAVALVQALADVLADRERVRHAATWFREVAERGEPRPSRPNHEPAREALQPVQRLVGG